MNNIDYCVCTSRAPYDRSCEGWVVDSFCSRIIACDILIEGEAKHPATTTHCGYVTCDKHHEGGMKWTTEFPTKAGWYWIRNVRFKFAIDDLASSAPDPQIINLDGDLRVVEIRFEGARVPLMPGVSDRCADQLISAEWYGPIEPPA